MSAADKSAMTEFSLRQLQTDFKSYLMQGHSDIERQVLDQGALDADFRLQIYANAYVARLVEALESDYEALAALLGEEDFYDLAHAYINRHPSRFTSLRWFGQFMASFLESTPPYDSQQHMWELARFEWALVQAFNSPDFNCVKEADMAGLQAQQWPSLRFRFNPSVHLCPYAWNIIPIWQAMRQEQPIPAPQALDTTDVCLVWRNGLNTQFRTLEGEEALLLPAAMQGADFSELCQLLLDSDQLEIEADQLALTAAGALKTWIHAGLLEELIL